MDLDPKGLHLALVPGEKVAELALEARRRGLLEDAAQMVGLLVDDRPVPAQGEHTRGLHAADAATHDGDATGRGRWPDVVLLVLHGLGVHGAAREVQRVLERLGVGVALVVAHVEAAVVAADAGANVLLAPLDELGHPLAVGKELASKANGIELALGNRLRAHVGVHAPRAHDGNVHEALDVLHVREVAVLGHVDGRVRPVPGVIGAVVAVEHRVALVGEVVCRPLGLLHRAPDLNVVLAGKRALAEALRPAYHRVAKGNREVLSCCVVYSMDDAHGEAVAVLARPAIDVVAVVHVGERELVEEVALVHGVHLDAVDSGVAKHFCAVRERLHQAVDLADGHLAGGHLVRPAVGRGRRRRADLVEVHEGARQRAQKRVGVELLHGVGDGEAAPETGCELHEHLCPRGVQLLHEGLELLVHGAVLVQPLSADGVVDGLAAGKEQAHVVLGALHEEAGAVTVEVVLLHPAKDVGAAHGRHDNAILDLASADVPWGEQWFKPWIHIVPSLLACAHHSARHEQSSSQKRSLPTSDSSPSSEATSHAGETPPASLGRVLPRLLSHTHGIPAACAPTTSVSHASPTYTQRPGSVPMRAHA